MKAKEISIPRKKKIRLFGKNELTGSLSAHSRVVGGTGRREIFEKDQETVKTTKKMRKGKTKKKYKNEKQKQRERDLSKRKSSEENCQMTIKKKYEF